MKAGNPDAVWVMQGWMFGYQRDIWIMKPCRL
ncbi:MAG: alpha-N-acetylglucosaminidase TIM-barrel domain-containing protein [Odoribacter splanchnicus]